MPSTDSRSGGGNGEGTGAASLEENPGRMVHGKEAPAKETPDSAASATADEKGRAGPWEPGSCRLWPNPASEAHPQRKCAYREASWSPGQGLGTSPGWAPPCMSPLTAAIKLACPGLSLPTRLRSPKAECVHPSLCAQRPAEQLLRGGLQPQEAVRALSLGGIKKAKEVFLPWRNLWPLFPP